MSIIRTIVFFGNRAFHCWQKKGHGSVALHKAVVESCDVYFYELGGCGTSASAR